MINIFLLFTIAAGILITAMFFLLLDLVLLTLSAFPDLTTHTLAFLALLVCFKTILPIEVAITDTAIEIGGYL